MDSLLDEKQRLTEFWDSIGLDYDLRREYLMTHEWVNGYWIDTTSYKHIFSEMRSIL